MWCAISWPFYYNNQLLFLPSLEYKDFKHVNEIHMCMYNGTVGLVWFSIDVSRDGPWQRGVIFRLEEIVMHLNSLLLQQFSVFLAH